MTHKHNKAFYPVAPAKSKEWLHTHQPGARDASVKSAKPALEMVLKCDSTGSLEAVSAAVVKAAPPDTGIHIIYSGIGDIHKSDILMAETGSRLIAGFQVDVPSGVDRELIEHNVEARLYNVIYKLTDDLRGIAEGMAPHVLQEETITGSARIIALFKSSRKGIIIGCEVLDGHLAVGQHFRIISAMGPVYSGTIESMHIEKNVVQKAIPGQKVGIKIRDFNKAKIADIVESFRYSPAHKTPGWQPAGGVKRL
ncbi:MAG: hypothetical protein C4526_00190 [Nitrospiraceae bacterium]|nr:MAG: hypothetical protein C4526_00190 [Nitrospiraceae bacterium]